MHTGEESENGIMKIHEHFYYEAYISGSTLLSMPCCFICHFLENFVQEHTTLFPCQACSQTKNHKRQKRTYPFQISHPPKLRSTHNVVFYRERTYFLCTSCTEMTIECKHHDYFKQPITLVLSIKVTQRLKDTSDNCTLYEKMQVT